MNVATRKLVEEFLSLPPDALPSAQFVHDDGLGCDTWEELREFHRTGAQCGIAVYIRADRDEWRDGHTILV